MVGSKPLIQIRPEYTRTLRRIKSGTDWEAQIPKPTIQSDDTWIDETKLPWPTNKTICLYEVEPWRFTFRNQTIKQLYDWCISKNLSLLEYGYCIVIEQTETGEVYSHRACFLFKKLKHALLFKLTWNGITDETGEEL